MFEEFDVKNKDLWKYAVMSVVTLLGFAVMYVVLLILFTIMEVLIHG